MHICTILSFVVCISAVATDDVRHPRVGVIGAGIGGTSASYFLSKLLPGAEITVFEKGEVGGRLATVEVNGRRYESGGAIIHDANRYMVEYLDLCGLQRRKTPADERFSLHKSGKIVFQEWGFSLVDKARMAWKYGVTSLLRLETFFSDILTRFLGIYEKLEDGVGYATVTEVLHAMDPDMVGLTTLSLKDKLAQLDLSKDVIEELVTVATRFNYGQMPDTVHAFVGAVGLIGFDKKLWAVEGGNFKVAQCALEMSGARLVRAEVSEVRKSDDEDRFVVNYSRENSSELVTEEFDVVIIAAPLTADKTSMILPFNQVFPGKYHTTLATVVRGNLVPDGVGYIDDNSTTPNNFYLSTTYPMWSVEKLTPVDYDPTQDQNLPPVYKLFSSRQLKDAELSSMFSDIESVSVTNWLAYPSYTVSDDLTNFQVSPGMFYTSRIEWAASAMEMSVIAAKNIANMVAEYLDKDQEGLRKGDVVDGLKLEL